MSGRKNKNKQRGQRRGQSSELLDELSSLRDLLGSDDMGDIPLLDRVAEPGKPNPPTITQPKPQPSATPPLDEIDLPILFSPVDEELPDGFSAELNESDRELLRPLQDLPATGRDKEPSVQREVPSAQQEEPSAQQEVPSAPSARPKETDATPRPEHQGELFEQPAPPVNENPFLPAHIRARLTGGRVPRAEEQPQEQPVEESPLPEETPETAQLPEAGEPAAGPLADAGEAVSGPEPEGGDASERETQRRQLVDRLVAKQLPELERQLRARIERMLDELEAKH